MEEKYINGNDVIYFIVYKRTTGTGIDEVLQHKLFGSTETAHITLHPDGTVNFRVERTRAYLEMAVENNMSGYTPKPSQALIRFLSKVVGKI